MEEYTQESIEIAAKTAHEINRVYCKGLGDTSQLPWSETAKWQRESAIRGVQAIIKNPSIQPNEQHEAWYADKEKDGWKYGLLKDPEKKEHPCMVSYDELPLEQRTKDVLFGASVRGVLRTEV